MAHTPEELQSQAIASFNETNGDKMNKVDKKKQMANKKFSQVRVIEFSATPRAKTPDNAARRERRKTKVVPRTISPLHPTRRFDHLTKYYVYTGGTPWHMILVRCGDGFTEGMEMLEASRMDRTDVTQGDLEELCESSVGGNTGQEDVSGFLGLPSTSGELLTPGEGSALTPASVESASRTLTGFNISGTSLYCL